MNPVLEALNFRHACKQFDPRRRIPEQTLREILECARLSPSSFGMEPWRFLVLRDAALRERLRPACWGQAQITDSSEVVAILTRSESLVANGEYAHASYARRGLSEERVRASLSRYGDYLENEVRPLMSLYAWASKQCYIALANIMTAAAAVGVDSCPIEGFEKHAVEEVLGLPDGDFQIAVLVALGYRAGEQTPRFRHAFDEIVEYR